MSRVEKARSGRGAHDPVSRRGLLVGLALAVAMPLGLLVAGGLLQVTTDGALSSVAGNYIQAAADAVLLVLVVVVVTVTGLRWSPVLRETRRRRSVVAVVLLGLWALLTVAQVLFTLDAGTGSYLLSVLVVVTLVAVVEELIYRGVLITGLRSALPEWGVWLGSVVLFALAHSVADLSSGFVLPDAFLLSLGSACYAARRVTGTLAAPVAVHLLFDLAIGLRAQAETAPPVALQLAAGLVLVGAAVAGAILAIRKNPTAQDRDATIR